MSNNHVYCCILECSKYKFSTKSRELLPLNILQAYSRLKNNNTLISKKKKNIKNSSGAL